MVPPIVVPPIVVVPDLPKPPVDNRDARDKNNEIAFATARKWCKDKGYSEDKTVAVLQRLAMVLVTESSGGYIYANDGTAYDFNKSTSWNGGLTRAVQDRVSYALRLSLAIPHDRIGSNGRSTGMFQQISLAANKALDPAIKWGWSSIAETMSPETSTLMFLNALTVTNDPVYKGAKTISPVVADVLRVQQPLASEASSSNYGQKNLDWAISISQNPSRYFTDRV